MTPAKTYKLWDLIDHARETIDGAVALHLVIGRPPMVRTADRELVFLGEDYPDFGFREITLLLQLVVEPERWEVIERVGEGEVVLSPPSGGNSVRLTIYRSSEAWQAVAHF